MVAGDRFHQLRGHRPAQIDSLPRPCAWCAAPRGTPHAQSGFSALPPASGRGSLPLCSLSSRAPPVAASVSRALPPRPRYARPSAFTITAVVATVPAGYRGYDVGAQVASDLYGPPRSRPKLDYPSLPPSAQSADGAAGQLPISPRHAASVFAAGLAIGAMHALWRARGATSRSGSLPAAAGKQASRVAAARGRAAAFVRDGPHHS